MFSNQGKITKNLLPIKINLPPLGIAFLPLFRSLQVKQQFLPANDADFYYYYRKMSMIWAIKTF